MSLKRNLAANFLGQAWVAAMGLAFLPLYVRYLGTEALGLIGIFTLLQAWLTILDFGITPTMTREMARFTAGGHSAQSIGDLTRSLEVVAGSIAIVIAVSIWTASGYLARSWLQVQTLPTGVVAQALAVMGMVIATRFLEGIYRGALLGLQRQVFFNVVNAAMATLRSAGALAVLVFVSPTIRAFYLWQAGVSIATVTVFAIAVHRHLPPASARVSRQALNSIRRFAGGMLAISLLSLLVSQLDKVLLSKLLPLEQFGYYTLAATAAGALTMAVAPVLQSIFPTLVELATRGAQTELAATYHRGAQLVSLITIPAMLLLTLFPWGVVYAWSGDATLASHAAPLLRPLALGSFLNALMWMPYQSQLAHGWTRLTIQINAAAVVALVPAIVFLVPRYGAPAAAWCWVALNATYVVVGIHFMHRRILPGEKLRWYRDDIAKPLLGAAAVAALSVLLAPTAASGRITWVVYLGLVGLVASGVALLLADQVRHRAWRLVRLGPSSASQA